MFNYYYNINAVSVKIIKNVWITVIDWPYMYFIEILYALKEYVQTKYITMYL